MKKKCHCTHVDLLDRQCVNANKTSMSLYIFRFNPAFNMASIKQAINEAVERGMCIVSV